MAKYCKNCGFPIFENDKECENCGMSIPNNEKVEKKNKTKKENTENKVKKENNNSLIPKEKNFNIDEVDINLLIKTAKNIETLEKELLKSKLDMVQFKSKLWIETDFEYILNKVKPTIKDKELYIQSQKEYLPLENKIIEYRTKLNLEKKLYQIYYAERYNKKEDEEVI